MFKKFRSPKGIISISNTSGHSATIGKDFINVHESLWKLAYMEGAVTEDMIGLNKDYIAEKKAELQEVENSERAAAKELMLVILDDPTAYLDKKNRPVYQKMVSLTKKAHKKEFFESIWDEIVKERA